MNEDELNKCKNDPVYFVEKYLGFELLTWQKVYLKLYQSKVNFIWAGKRNGKRMLEDVIQRYEKVFKN